LLELRAVMSLAWLWQQQGKKDETWQTLKVKILLDASHFDTAYAARA
jgi:hypothetical protein